MTTNEYLARLADRIRAVLESPSDRLDVLVAAAGLNKADLRFGDWHDFDLSDADLRGFDFTGANLTGARFKGARIEGAIFDGATYEIALLREAADFHVSSIGRSAQSANPGDMRDIAALSDRDERAIPDSNATEPLTIKKYANKRLYNTGSSTYVTLKDLAAMVKRGEDFVVYDAKEGEDITRSVLTQIIFEQENKEGQNLLPITFLRQLIRFYGDSMQMLVPRYLEVSIESLTREQEKFRQLMARAFGDGASQSLEEQARRYMEMFERAFAMFTPFAKREVQGAEPTAEPVKAAAKPVEIDDLKRQLDEIQKKVDRLTEKDEARV